MTSTGYEGSRKTPAAYAVDDRDLGICAALDAGLMAIGVREPRGGIAARFAVSKSHIDRLAQELARLGGAA